MTTTYGTIATDSPPPSTAASNVETFTRAKDRLRSAVARRRRWSELVALRSLSFPSSFSDSLLRIRTNVAYFRSNYLIVILLILFLSLLWHPISLIVFLAVLLAWLFLYFLREAPLVVFGREIDDRIVIGVLSVLTIVFLLLTDVTVNVIVAVVIGVVVVVVHATVRRTDDLEPDVGEDEEAGTRVVYRGVGTGARLPLKDTASSSFTA
ncbi:hypothetical protein Droror1_Dr00007312 [Drosera rotundifolia]